MVTHAARTEFQSLIFPLCLCGDPNFPASQAVFFKNVPILPMPIQAALA